jgi:hypothetical protein
MLDNIRPANLGEVNTYPLSQRNNKVKITDFAKVCLPGNTINELINSLPNILVGKDFREVIQAIVNAYRINKPVIFGIGAHVIKCGLSPWLIELMQQGVVTSIAMNGATSIHDFEIALVGETSEDVASGLVDGTFGMASETGNLIYQACNCDEVLSGKMGMGQALGQKLLEINPPYINYSVLAQAVKLNVPVTVHSLVGAEIIYMHNNNAGVVFGRASGYDFRLLTELLKFITNGGVYLNIGSAITLPEVFLKALTVAQNLGADIKDFVTVNLDMEHHYRPMENVVKRPEVLGAKGYTIIGRHELMIPLLGFAVLELLYDEVNK